MNKFVIYQILIYSFFLLFVSHPLMARDTGVTGTNLEFFSPSTDPYGYFSVESPKGLKAGEPFFKITQTLASKYILQSQINGVTLDVVDHMLTTHAVGSVGINDFLSLSVVTPFHPWLKESNINDLEKFTTASLGDILASFKFRLLKEKGKRPGVALRMTNHFPTGDEEKFTSFGHLVLGGDLLVEKKFRHFDLTANAGARFPRQKTILGANFDDWVTYGAALRVPLGFWDRKLSVMGEIRGHFEPNRLQTLTAPVEYNAGFQKEFKKGWILQLGGGGALNNAVGNPSFRGVFSVGYTPGLKHPAILYFKTNAITPVDESMVKLSRWADHIRKKKKIAVVQVEGHADSHGSPAYNMILSRRRAETVKKLLIDRRVKPEIIEATGFGEEKPAVDGLSPESLAKNRRVEITFPRK